MTTKAEVRRIAYRRRRQQRDPVSVSRAILERLFASTPYQTSRTILFYVGVRSEVSTIDHVSLALAAGKSVFVPLCEANELQLFQLKSIDELAPGTYGIPEPKVELRDKEHRNGSIDEIELAIVPGVAFGRDGSRIGNGRGYYDRLFRSISSPTIRVGVAFECQIFDTLPIDEHDVWMDAVVTESAVYGPNKRLIEGDGAGVS